MLRRDGHPDLFAIPSVLQCRLDKLGSMKISRRNPCSPFFSVSYSINRHKILHGAIAAVNTAAFTVEK